MVHSSHQDRHTLPILDHICYFAGIGMFAYIQVHRCQAGKGIRIVLQSIHENMYKLQKGDHNVHYSYKDIRLYIQDPIFHRGMLQ